MNKKQKKKCQKLANRHRPNHDKFLEMVVTRKGQIVGYWHTPELKKDKISKIYLYKDSICY